MPPPPPPRRRGGGGATALARARGGLAAARRRHRRGTGRRSCSSSAGIARTTARVVHLGTGCSPNCWTESWDGAVIGAIVWETGTLGRPSIAAMVALTASYLSSYVRARGAALGYSVEESHVTRGLR